MPRRIRSLIALGEHGFLARLLDTLPSERSVIVGPGDDCAVVALGARRYLLTTDTLVQGVHFRAAWLTAYQLGRRAYWVNASDIAAMGGAPRYALVSICVPARYGSRDLLRLNQGIVSAATETGACVVGGNLARSSVLSVSITLVGESTGRPVLRRGARVGDDLFVTGELGAAAFGRQLIRRNAQAGGVFARRFREPIARLQAGALLARERVASAMIDVSDGLLQDVGHLCRSSAVGAHIEMEELPCSRRVRAAGYALALTGGEDYELVCAVPPHRLARMRELQHKFGCQMTRIGRVMPETYGVQVVDACGKAVRLGTHGFDHFRAER